MGILPSVAVVCASTVISNGCVSLKSAPAWRGKYMLLYSDKFTPGMKLQWIELQSNMLMLQGPILTGMPGLDLITQLKVRPSLSSEDIQYTEVQSLCRVLHATLLSVLYTITAVVIFCCQALVQLTLVISNKGCKIYL